MAEAIEVVKEKSEKSVLPSDDVRKYPLQEHTENVHPSQKTTDINLQQGGVRDKDLNNEHKKKKKKKKSKSAENTATAYPELQNEMQSSGGEICAPQLNSKQQIMMAQHHIQLIKPTLKNPRGRFMCKLCNYFCDIWKVVEKHINKQSHFFALEDYIEAESVKLLPPPLDEQKSLLTDLILKIVSEHGISKFEDRNIIFERIRELIKASYPSCTVTVYGSSKYLAGLTHSDVNLNITIPSTQDRPKIMMAVYDRIKGDIVNNRNVDFNMSADIPTITFEDLSSNIPCSISFNNDHSCDVAHVLNKLLSLDTRALQLATSFRYWAHCLT